MALKAFVSLFWWLLSLRWTQLLQVGRIVLPWNTLPPLVRPSKSQPPPKARLSDLVLLGGLSDHLGRKRPFEMESQNLDIWRHLAGCWVFSIRFDLWTYPTWEQYGSSLQFWTAIVGKNFFLSFSLKIPLSLCLFRDNSWLPVPYLSLVCPQKQ